MAASATGLKMQSPKAVVAKTKGKKKGKAKNAMKASYKSSGGLLDPIRPYLPTATKRKK